MWDILDVRCWGMCDVQDVECLRCDMLGMWDIGM